MLQKYEQLICINASVAKPFVKSLNIKYLKKYNSLPIRNFLIGSELYLGILHKVTCQIILPSRDVRKAHQQPEFANTIFQFEPLKSIYY